MRTVLRVATTVLAAAAAAVIPAAASAATPKPAPTPGVVTNALGIVGYADHAPGIRLGDLHWQMPLTQAAATAVGTSAADGSTITGSMAGELCDPATGYTVQLAAIYTGGGQWEFAYAAGTLTGPGNPCLSGVLSGGVTTHLLTWPSGSPVTVPSGDTVRAEIATSITRHAVTGRAVIFRIFDETTGTLDFSTGPLAPATLGLPAWPQFHQAAVLTQLAPVQEVTAALTPATSVTFAQVADYAGQHQYLDGRWPSTPVEYTADGTLTGTVLGSTQASLAGGHFTVFADPAVIVGS